MKTRAIQGVAVVAGLALIGTGGAFAAKSSGSGSTSHTGVQFALANGVRAFSSGSLPAQATAMADATAAYLGLTRAELIQQVKSGKTLAQIAGEQGKSVDGLVDALIAAGTAQLDKKVADGTLSKAQRDAIVSQLKDRITAFVNSTGTGPGFGPGPGFGTGGSPFGGGSGGPPSGVTPFSAGA
jgi:hypothetical protein